MGMHTERLLYDLSAPVAFLRREAGGNFHHLMTSPCSLIFKYFNEGSPGSIGDTLGEMMVLEHAVDMQVLNTDMGIALCVGLGRLEQEVAPLAFDFEMGLGAIARCLPSPLAALLAAAELPLLAA